MCSIFLYLFLLVCTAGVGYFFYTIWVAPYFPQKKKVKTTRTPSKKTEGEKTEADTSATATGSKGYAEEWIPTHHLQRPEARRVKSGGPRPKSRQG